jgi:hypothetical protein
MSKCFFMKANALDGAALHSNRILTRSVLFLNADLETTALLIIYVYLASQELKRIWDDRSQVPWGMPGKEFDEKLALLQVSPLPLHYHSFSFTVICTAED